MRRQQKDGIHEDMQMHSEMNEITFMEEQSVGQNIISLQNRISFSENILLGLRQQQLLLENVLSHVVLGQWDGAGPQDGELMETWMIKCYNKTPSFSVIYQFCTIWMLVKCKLF